jgi:hypothetical protein
MLVDLVDQPVDVRSVILRRVQLKDDFGEKLHANPLAKLVPDPP